MHATLNFNVVSVCGIKIQSVEKAKAGKSNNVTNKERNKRFLKKNYVMEFSDDVVIFFLTLLFFIDNLDVYVAFLESHRRQNNQYSGN